MLQIQGILLLCNFSSVRTTVVHALRRAGYPTEEIMELTGHKSQESLAASYNFSIDTSDRLNMSAAIGYGPQLSRGEIKDTEGIY